MTKRSKKRDREIEALLKLADEDIDTSDIPEVRDWSKAVVGRFYRPLKEPVSLRLDVDILAWLRAQGAGYQTRINGLLREAMAARAQSAGTRPSTKGTDARPSRPARFPALEKHGELGKCDEEAAVIEERGCVFAAVG